MASKPTANSLLPTNDSRGLQSTSPLLPNEGRRMHKMPIADRAKQFMPFSALRGLSEALSAKERITVPKAELSEEMSEELDRRMHQLNPGQIVTAVYFHRDEYLKITGMVARIDATSRLLQIVNTKIPFEDLFSIEAEN